MSDQDKQDVEEQIFFEEENTSSLKEKIAIQSAKGGEIAQEDTSRNALHTGERPDADPERQLQDDEGGSDSPDALSGSLQASALSASAADDTDSTSPDVTLDQSAGLDTNDDASLGLQPAPMARLRRTAGSNDQQEVLRAPDAGSTASITESDGPFAPASPTSQPGAIAGTGTDADDPETPNRAPDAIILDRMEVAENQEGAVVGKLSIADADTADSHDITLSDDRFEVVDGELRLKPGVTLDHEAESAISLNVTATDSGGAQYTQSFDITVADVNEAPTELALEGGFIASNTAGAVVGRVTLTDPDAGDTHQYSVSDDRFEVADGVLKLRDDAVVSDAELGVLNVQVTATDQGGALISETFAFEAVDAADVALSSGFHASYFDVDHSLSRLDQIDWSSDPTHEEVVSEINYKNGRASFWEGGATDTFGAKITGNIDVEEGGSFDFFLGGDDGAMLFVNGVEVIENDGLHAYHTRSGQIELEPGTHTIEVRYFENYGHAGLKLEWDGPGTDGRELVTSPGVDDLQTVNGIPLTLELDLNAPGTGAAHQVTQFIEGLPEGTVVSAGDMTAEAGADGAVEISSWDTALLSIQTPLGFIGDVSAQIVTTTAFDDGGAVSTTNDLEFSVSQADLPPHSAQMQTGFHASYFDVNHSLRQLDQIDWSSEPTHEEVVSEINYKNGRGSFWEDGSADTFGAKITGNIEVEEGGSFDFFLGGDDGAMLFVNGVEVIENDGLHAYHTRSGEIELEPGTHTIEVRYFENFGHAGLKLEWDGPGTDGRELVVASDDLSVAENGVIPVNIGGGELSDQASVQISGLPEDTILMSEDNVLVADGNDVDLTGWDLTLLEIAPPPGFEGTISGEITTTDVAFNGQEQTSSDSFSINVGEVSTSDEAQSDQHSAQLMTADDEDTGSGDWVAASESEPRDDDSSEDVMNEDVEHQGSEAQGYEVTETYERQDW
ncbi:hypothetical protein KX928_14270 [Roseobacter sp. YSTF-M11]|uniref:PA14 domain-containing protein n=1 Tax=Roseobacter insulae TaxID=2859783 RepID=A0A9X1FWE7_9RHOB|nr:PA14 domain-containing protein [Roseobacter insulae]MBW4708951.1 hypothetical protein [Roseobacter insulae]